MFCQGFFYYEKYQYLCTVILCIIQQMTLLQFLIFEGFHPGSQVIAAGDLISLNENARSINVYSHRY